MPTVRTELSKSFMKKVIISHFIFIQGPLHKNEVFHCAFFQSQFPVDLVTFTEEIRDGTLHFLSSGLYQILGPMIYLLMCI